MGFSLGLSRIGLTWKNPLVFELASVERAPICPPLFCPHTGCPPVDPHVFQIWAPALTPAPTPPSLTPFLTLLSILTHVFLSRLPIFILSQMFFFPFVFFCPGCNFLFCPDNRLLIFPFPFFLSRGLFFVPTPGGTPPPPKKKSQSELTFPNVKNDERASTGVGSDPLPKKNVSLRRAGVDLPECQERRRGKHKSTKKSVFFRKRRRPLAGDG